jgi:DNA-binding transcriptional ArsR family regulator
MYSLAKFSYLLSDSTRIRILLLLLNNNELCVCQLMGALGMSQARISRQLKILKLSDLVTSYRIGKWAYYKINPELKDDDPVTALLASIPKWLNGDRLGDSDRIALRTCLKQQEKTGRCDLKSFQGIREKVDG